MIATTALLALTTLGAANYAAAMEAVNQLETPRLVQGDQRVEFGVQGDNSAFKFRFADTVIPPISYPFAPLHLPTSTSTYASQSPLFHRTAMKW
jgi:hypothetical protein